MAKEEATDETAGMASGGGLTLTCPIRGVLKATAKRKDLLGPSEEKLRIDAIQHLLDLGYPAEHITHEAIVIKLGNSGRNSVRTDVVAYDVPVAKAKAFDTETRLKHADVLIEVKREHIAVDKVKETQVKPLLWPSKVGAKAVYWDDVEQRVFWMDKDKNVFEAPLNALPRYGEKFAGVPKLTMADLKKPASVLELFDRIEDDLHGASIDKERRFTIMLQLLLAKLYDEMEHEGSDQPLSIQDPIGLGIDPDVALDRFNTLLKEAVGYFSTDLPIPIAETVEIKGAVLAHVLSLLADRDLSHVAPRLMQDFFMKFAKDLYKWDMAQYFTPVSISEFIVEVVNPGHNQTVKDPAQGSADFLLATHRRRAGRKQLKTTLFGADDSRTAHQVAQLNKVVHGAQMIDLTEHDSLENVDSDFSLDDKGLGKYDVVICNPPFGTSITEKRPDVLEKFTLGHDLRLDRRTGKWEGDKLRKAQQKGLLFLEACVRMTKPGGRIAIILPNGYLGNRGPQYLATRNWMLAHCRIAAIVSFPRFTFKQSGADVSASLVVLEKRMTPIDNLDEDNDYSFAVELVERPGWELGNKVGKPTWKRDPQDGTEIVISGEKILDFDLDDLRARLRGSDAHTTFPWLGGEGTASDAGWSVHIKDVLNDGSLTLDPKRHSQKVADARAAVVASDHFRVGDVIQVIPEMSATVVSMTRKAAQVYQYVEISDVGSGSYAWTEMRGWELPSRAKHEAQDGDVFIGSIWGSVSKWFLAGGTTDHLVVTNGFHRVRLREGKEGYLLDLLAGICTESWAVQMRASARGSDGLAEVTAEDLSNVVLPRVTDKVARAELEAFVVQLRKGHTSIKAAIESMGHDGRLPVKDPARRPSHVVLV